MSVLTASDFPAFFAGVHGREPFPWQTRLAEQVLAEGWPDVLELPTGVGKTSALDVAVFALAVAPARSPRRMILVVDRRIVVDQAAEHGRRLQRALHRKDNQNPVVAAVAEALRGLWRSPDGATPADALLVAVLHGAMPKDDAWARRPDAPVIVLSTVDQVGSRLFFRGYGVSARMAPIHAGLLGHDTLFLLDEVHLSTVFAETLLAVRDRWRGWHGDAVPDRWAVVRMSATAGAPRDGQRSFGLDARDRSHPILQQRMTARKLARLEQVQVGRSEDDRRAAFAAALVAHGRAFVRAGRASVAIVVNRVDTARRVANLLRCEAELGADAVLLTGRMRPLDREHVLGKEEDPTSVLARVLATDARPAGTRALVVVATQCIEAGADFDFDALVTECASLDALKQRFGRLDRRGLRGDCPAVIAVRSDATSDKGIDPVYGGALAATWAFLKSREAAERVDCGCDAFPSPATADALSPLLAPRPTAPLLLPAHLDAWVQTSPPPEPDPVVAEWLHGPDCGPEDVRVVWRADVSAPNEDSGPGGDEDEDATDPAETLTACPPSTLEAIAVPIWEVRRWLTDGKRDQEHDQDLADVEGTNEVARSQAPAARGEIRGRTAWRWLGHRVERVTAAGVHPGDTLVVPAGYGGIARETFSWDPSSHDRVDDLGDLAQLRHRGRATLRLDLRVLSASLLSRRDDLSAAVRSPPRVEPDEADIDVDESILDYLDALRETTIAPRFAAILEHLPRELRKLRKIAMRKVSWTLIARRRVSDASGGEISTEDDGASFIDCEVALRAHSDHVRGWVRRFALNLSLPEAIVDDLALTGWLHDTGKADPRFQRMLVGGSEVRLAMLAEPLAKSAGSMRDRAAREQARTRAGYPLGYRHELLSVALAERTPEVLAAAHDRDLVLHLVGSHHGWCRPFAPPLDDPDDLEVVLTHGDTALRASSRHGLARLDSGVSDRFWDLVDRYGWWGLAWLEAILRLADHRASEAEQETAAR